MKEELMAFMVMVESELARRADEWATMSSESFSSGVRTGLRLARSVMRNVYEQEYGHEKKDPI